MGSVRTVAIFGLALCCAALVLACGGGGTEEKPGERITDPARVPTSSPIQNPTLYKILGNEVSISGGGTSSITPVAVSTPTSSDYVVKEGDLCSTIAADHGITVAELQSANRLMDCDRLHIGDKVKIPSKVVPTPTRGGTISGNPTARPGSNGGTYTVKVGDTCGAIASENGVTLAAFLAANPAIDAECSNLDAGQVVNIP
ncbi:MAG: LysM peptidoglycan-binding domain-containing protein [Dehalococcoidia bacterium]